MARASQDGPSGTSASFRRAGQISLLARHTERAGEDVLHDMALRLLASLVGTFFQPHLDGAAAIRLSLSRPGKATQNNDQPGSRLETQRQLRQRVSKTNNALDLAQHIRGAAWGREGSQVPSNQGQA